MRPPLWPALLALLTLDACAAIPPAPDRDAGLFVDFPFAEVARIDHPPLDELSGLLASRRWPGTVWGINDSGAAPSLFALDADFRMRIPRWLDDRYVHGAGTGTGTAREPWPGIQLVGATLIDWEALARIDDLIYVADVGNNGNARRDLGFWELVEPVPDATERARPIRYLRVHYPQQEQFPGRVWEWDCEAVFADAGMLYLITKHRAAGEIGRLIPGARLYRFEPGAAPEASAAQPSTPLTLISRHPQLVSATGADLSPDGRWLAVLSYTAIWFFPRPVDGDDWLAATPVIRPLPILQTRQAESIAWEDDDVLLFGNEDGVLFRMAPEAGSLGDALDAALESAETP